MPNPPRPDHDRKRREAEGRTRLKAFLEAASAAMGAPVGLFDLLDLLTTDNLADEFAAKADEARSGAADAVRRTWPGSQLQRLLAGLAGIADTDPQRPVMVFLPESDLCGAVVQPLEAAIARAGELLRLGGGTLRIGTKDMSDGLLLSPASESDSAELAAPTAFELIVWGDEWAPAVG
jgi:hypothetical protein